MNNDPDNWCDGWFRAVCAIAFVLIVALVCAICMLVMSGCTTTHWRKPLPQGGAVLTDETTLLGLKVCAKTTYEPSPAEQVAEAKAQAKVEAALRPGQQQARVSSGLFWLGMAAAVGALAAIVLGVVTKGWRLFGGLACAAAGSSLILLALSMQVRWFWTLLALPLFAGILFGLHHVREFDVRDWWRARKATKARVKP